MDLKDIKKGDIVMCLDYQSRAKSHVVSAAGGKWISVTEYGRTSRYHRDTGNRDDGHGRIMTVEGHAAFVRQQAAGDELRRLGIDSYKIPNDKLEAVLAAVKPILEGP
jgi:pyruvoyl-dependent arginine decarboxylase (PvlArgDC)